MEDVYMYGTGRYLARWLSLCTSVPVRVRPACASHHRIPRVQYGSAGSLTTGTGNRKIEIEHWKYYIWC